MNYQGPGTYRHYKGDKYLVVGLGAEEATLTPVVIYRPWRAIMPADVKEKAGVHVHYWTRPLDDFNAEVEVPDGCSIPEHTHFEPRFTLIDTKL